MPYALDPLNKEPQSHLVDILSFVPGFLEDVLRLSSLSRPLPRKTEEQCLSRGEFPTHTNSQKHGGARNLHSSLVERVKQSLVALYRWRWHWQRRFGKDVGLVNEPTPRKVNTSPSNPDSKPCFSHPKRLKFALPSAAAAIALYNAVLMWLITLLWDLEPFYAGIMIEQCAEQAMEAATVEAVTGDHKEDLNSMFDFGYTSPGDSDRCTSFEPLQRPGAAFSVRDPAIEICRIFEWQSQNHSAGYESNFLYMFPIGMAITVLDTEPEYREWIRGLLDVNEYTRGYGGYLSQRQKVSNYPSQSQNYPTTLNITSCLPLGPWSVPLSSGGLCYIRYVPIS